MLPYPGLTQVPIPQSFSNKPLQTTGHRAACSMPEFPRPMKGQKQLLTVVGESPIHGKGLFARQAIKKGTIIGYLEGQKTNQDGMYVLWLDHEQGFEVTCDLRYINHADRPNACYYDDLSVVAIKNIKKGEEITHNYEADW